MHGFYAFYTFFCMILVEFMCTALLLLLAVKSILIFLAIFFLQSKIILDKFWFPKLLSVEMYKKSHPKNNFCSFTNLIMLCYLERGCCQQCRKDWRREKSHQGTKNLRKYYLCDLRFF